MKVQCRKESRARNEPKHASGACGPERIFEDLGPRAAPRVTWYNILDTSHKIKG